MKRIISYILVLATILSISVGSLTSPSRITRMRSAFFIVERRCAMTKLVRPFVRESIALWIKSSVRVSTDEVASLRISIGAFCSMARAIVSSCFCPADMPALSVRTVSKPSGSARMNLSSPQAGTQSLRCAGKKTKKGRVRKEKLTASFPLGFSTEKRQ